MAKIRRNNSAVGEESAAKIRRKNNAVGEESTAAGALLISLEGKSFDYWFKINLEHFPKVSVTKIKQVPFRADGYLPPFHAYCSFPPSQTISVESKIYIIGGFHRAPLDSPVGPPSVLSSNMCVYDLINETWVQTETNHEMQVGRGAHTVVAIGSVIYVFGGATIVSNEFGELVIRKIPMERWGEFYDTRSQKWEFLPTHPPQQVADSRILLHAVYEKHHEILFWVHKVGVCSYNYVTHIWSAPSEYSSLNQIDTLRLCYRVVVVGDTLFWHFHGRIHAYDLNGKQYLFSHALDKSYTNFFDGGAMMDVPDPNFLLSVEKDTLLLLYWDFDGGIRRRFQCYRFRIIMSSHANANSGGVHSLVPDGCGLFDICDGDELHLRPTDVVLVA